VDPVADWARSGVVALTGWPDGPPLVPPGRAASVAAELADRFAAVTGVHVDGPRLLSERAAFTGHRRRGAVSAGGACRLLPTADGWAAVSCARPDDPALLGALVGEDIGDDPWPTVMRWLAEHSGAELAERAALLGVAAAPVSRPATFSATVPAPFPAPPERPPPALAPASPALAQPVAPQPLTPRPSASRPSASRPLAGLLIADFSALWAGPLCAHLLGLAGARVVKVETPWRPDGARRGDAAFYRLLHAGHRSVALDPRTSDGRAAMAALVNAADIVIESSRPRALARFGLDAGAAVAAGTTWVSITAYGRAVDRVGFGDDVAAGSGLVATDADGHPLFCGDAIADPLTGLTAALLAADAARAPAGGALLDIAMSGVVAATLDTAAAGSLAAAGSPAGERAERSAAARHGADGWVVDTASGPVQVAQPHRRRVRGRAAELGEHTAEVLAELGIR
jgi:crotonobetainyl-CoA:carnitine CoA-transferase CaiB-like acyl-CoA transferase